MRFPALFLSLFFSLALFSQQLNIVPQPVSVKQPKIAAKFSINSNTVIVLEGSNLEKTAGYLNDYLQQFYSLQLKIVSTTSSNNAIRLNYERLDAPVEGAYIMTVDSKGIYISGDNETGIFYGIQTFIQLLPVGNDKLKTTNNKLDIPFVSIEDQPRFKYRGMHLDVARHFFPVSFVKKYIDYLAFHKLNIFHWHLTDDQGWRIEIKKYPKLTSVGGYRNGTIIGRYPGKGNDGIRYGGFYTQEEIKEVVKYAADHYITVIPEIEMPGHASAAIAAYPELSCFPNESTKHSKETAWSGDTTGKQVQQTWGVFEDVFCAGKENTFQFLENALDEVVPLFPSKYIHIGGDESPKDNWKRCPNCQQRIKDNHLKDEHQLQSYFIQRMEKYLNNKGKTIIGWDEILEGGLAPNAVVMSWRGEQGGIEAAKQKHNAIMTPGNPVYFDHSQTRNEDSVTIGGYNPLEKVYAYEPVAKEMNASDAKYVLGAQANLWTEYILYPSKVEYMVFPRMAALSEVLWGPKAKKDWNGFQKRLEVQFKRYEMWKVSYGSVK
ncbi:MAG: beta-N-acetylhexosaminidase [Chitinophagaceae bacterium]